MELASSSKKACLEVLEHADVSETHTASITMTHAHYIKDVSSKAVVIVRSVIPWKNKSVQEGLESVKILFFPWHEILRAGTRYHGGTCVTMFQFLLLK